MWHIELGSDDGRVACDVNGDSGGGDGSGVGKEPMRVRLVDIKLEEGAKDKVNDDNKHPK
jgi:hypothetical protein